MGYIEDQVKSAWQKTRYQHAAFPKKEFLGFTDKQFEELKDEYHKQFGYTIRVPTIDDIIHYKPPSMLSGPEKKLQKKMNFIRLLDSPSPDWLKEYASVMTLIDDIQDTQSIVYPMMKIVSRYAPKAFKKLLGVFGAVMSFYDALNFLNAIGRLNFGKMDTKRKICKYFKANPFTKKGRLTAGQQLEKWKPGMGDLIQALQVLDSLAGVGLSLGAIYGFGMDVISSPYHLINGDPVRFTFDKPDPSKFSFITKKATAAASVVSSTGQTFSDEFHFWAYQTAAMCGILISQDWHDYEMSDLFEVPRDILIPAPYPTDPTTIEVIQEEGLNVDDGIGWPFNREKFIPLGELIDVIVEDGRQHFRNYCIRHRKDMYGYQTGAAIEMLITQSALSFCPNAEWQMDDTDWMKVFFKMVKAPLLPTDLMTQQQADSFESWFTGHQEQVGKLPGVMQIQEYFDQQSIPYTTEYPRDRASDWGTFWDDEIDLTMETTED